MNSSLNKNVVLIGGGAVAIEFHLPRVLAVLGAERVEIVESDSGRREQLAKRFRGDQRIEVTGDCDLAQEIDLAVIATPPKFHADYFHALRGSARGVLIEKPVALDVAKAEGIRDALGNGGPTLWVNLVRRTLQSFTMLREFWLQDQFGALKSVELHEGRVYAWEAMSLGSFSKELNGGGVLMDTGPHVLDQLLQVFDEVELEHAFLDGETAGIEANATLLLRADGIPATVQMSRNRNLSNTATFQFERATCRIGVCDDHIEVTPRKGQPYSLLTGDRSSPAPQFNDLFDRFYVSKIAQQDASGVGIEESIASLQLIEEAYATGEPMRGAF